MVERALRINIFMSFREHTDIHNERIRNSKLEYYSNPQNIEKHKQASKNYTRKPSDVVEPTIKIKGVIYYSFPCIDCGKPHYSQKIQGKPRNPRCLSCAAIIRGTGRVCKKETKDKISKSLMGHVGSKYWLGKKQPKEAIQKRSLARKGKPSPTKGMKFSEETKLRMREGLNKYWASPKAEEHRKLFSKLTKERFAKNGHPMKGKHQKPEIIKKISETRRGTHVSEQARQNLIKSHSSPEYRARASENTKKTYANPDSFYHTQEYKEKCSNHAKQMFNDPNSKVNTPEYKKQAVDRMMNIIKNKKLCNYNKSEEKLDKIIQEVLPNQYGYNGGTQLGFRIHYHTPDFININGQKKIIEFNGCVWHCCEQCGINRHPIKKNIQEVRDKDKKNIEDAEKLGYKVLIIWEHDFKDIEGIKKKLVEFNNSK